MSKMSLVVVLALVACLTPGAMSSTCKDDKSVRNTVSSCLSLLSDPLMYRNLYADDIVERVEMEAGCDVKKVSSHVSFILEIFGKNENEIRDVVACVKRSL